MHLEILQHLLLTLHVVRHVGIRNSALDIGHGDESRIDPRSCKRAILRKLNFAAPDALALKILVKCFRKTRDST